MNAEKARSELGWQPIFDLASGLEHTFTLVEENIKALSVSTDYRHQE